MKCDEVMNQLEVFFDGAAGREQREGIEAHLLSCPECDVRLQQLQAMRKLLRKSVVSIPTASLDMKVMEAFHDRSSHSEPQNAGWRGLIFGSVLVPKPVLLLSLAVLVVALLVSFQIGRKTTTQVIAIDSPKSNDVTSTNAPPSVKKEIDNNSGTAPQPELTRPRERRMGRRTTSARSGVVRLPIVSFATVSPLNTTYSTRASLNGFEPLRETRIRLVKGDEQ